MKTYSAGTYIKVMLEAGFAGMDTYSYALLKRDFTEDELNETAYQMAKNHAEMYGIYPENEYSHLEIEEDPDSYSDNIEGWFEVASEEDAKDEGFDEWD